MYRVLESERDGRREFQRSSRKLAHMNKGHRKV